MEKIEKFEFYAHNSEGNFLFYISFCASSKKAAKKMVK